MSGHFYSGHGQSTKEVGTLNGGWQARVNSGDIMIWETGSFWDWLLPLTVDGITSGPES